MAQFFAPLVPPLMFVLSGAYPSALGQPMEAANLLGQGFESHILTIMPQAKFAVDDRLKRNVEFWIQVYTQYTTTQGLVHDAKYIDKIFEKIDFPKEVQESKRANRRYTKEVRERWIAVLKSVHKKQAHPETMDPTERKVFDMYADVNEPNKFLAAAGRKRLRIQLGQKDRFLDGLYQSGRYLPAMEKIFARENLPIELTRLPFVESSFNVHARSKVGASGIWQFMRSTARFFIKVNDAVDERNDPVRATEAAAALLRQNYETLKNWPLAVTAYNHGREGMERAVKKVGSEELEELVSEYHSRSFGFASTNFFTELLAAIEVERNSEKYFGKITRAKPVDSVEVPVNDFVQLSVLCDLLKLDLNAIRDLNPGLSEAVYAGARLIPAGYRLRLPLSAGTSGETAIKLFEAGYEQIPASYKFRAQKGRGLASRR